MLRQIIGKEVRELSSEDFQNLKSGFSKCVIDMGTGDGRYVYDMAKDDLQTLYVGVDADKQQMQDLSHKANRKPAKGGLDNVLFLWAPAEQVPQELVGCADELIINFPWGSLLSGLVKADSQMLQSLKSICKPNAKFTAYLTYDPKFEAQTIAEYELPELSTEYLQTTWATQMRQCGFDIQQISQLDEAAKHSLIPSWPKRILSQRDRVIYCIEGASV